MQHSDASPQSGAQHRNTQVPLGSFHTWQFLIPFGMVLGFWFQYISTTLFLVILERRASRSLANSCLFLSFRQCLFPNAFSDGRHNAIFSVFIRFVSLEGSFFSAFFCTFQFSCEDGVPSFVHTLTSF